MLLRKSGLMSVVEAKQPFVGGLLNSVGRQEEAVSNENKKRILDENEDERDC